MALRFPCFEEIFEAEKEHDINAVFDLDKKLQNAKADILKLQLEQKLVKRKLALCDEDEGGHGKFSPYQTNLLNPTPYIEHFPVNPSSYFTWHMYSFNTNMATYNTFFLDQDLFNLPNNQQVQATFTSKPKGLLSKEEFIPPLSIKKNPRAALTFKLLK